MDLLNFIEKDNFRKYLGIEITDHAPGYAKAKLEVSEHNLNSLGTVHGAVIFSLADAAFAVAANSHGGMNPAINVNISYMKALTGGVLWAEAREVSLNPKLGTYVIEVTDENQQLIALFNGMVYRKPDKPGTKS